MKKIKLLPITAGIVLSCTIPMTIIGPIVTNKNIVSKKMNEETRKKNEEEFKPHVSDTAGLLAFDANDESKYARAFYSNKQIETVKWVNPVDETEKSISDVTCTFIAKSQFAFSTLKSFTFPNSIVKIGDNAFLECNDLVSIDLTGIQQKLVEPNQEETFSLGKSSFRNINDNCVFKTTGLDTKFIPIIIARLLNAGAGTNCTLSNIESGSTKTYNFSDYSNIIPLDLMNLEVQANGTYKLNGFKPKAYDKDAYGNWYFTKLLIPGNITEFGEYCFQNLTSNIQEVEIRADNTGGGVSNIPAYAFTGFSQLKTVRLENSNIVLLGQMAFRQCPLLETVYLNNKLDTGVTISKRCFESAGTNATNGLVVCGSNEDEQAKINTIDSYAFYQTNIETLNFTNVETIGAYAFNESKVRTVTIPYTTREIGSYAFANCSNLYSLEFTEDSSATNELTIQDSCFQLCPLLTTFKPTARIGAIGNNAFQGCTALTKIDLSHFNQQNIKKWSDPETSLFSGDVFLNVYSVGEIKFPEITGEITAEKITIIINKFKSSAALPTRWAYIPDAQKNTTYALYEPGTTVTFVAPDGAETYPDIQVSLDYGETWINVGAKGETTLNFNVPIELPDSGSVVLVKGNNSERGCWSSENGQFKIVFGKTQTATNNPTIQLGGKLSGLLNGGTESSSVTVSSHCFQKLFEGSTSLVSVPTDFLGNITTLGEYCFDSMFYGCTNLVNAPDLPVKATSSTDPLPIGCYQGMFYGCENMVTCPELNSTNLSTSCYEDMFVGCKALMYMPSLPATNLENAQRCYTRMFMNCQNLGQISSISANVLSNGCFEEMFSGCSNLWIPSTFTFTIYNSAPNNCFTSMFKRCLKLISIPTFNFQVKGGREEQKFEFDTHCFNSTFSECLGLTEISINMGIKISQETSNIQDSSFIDMFSGCSNLNKIYIPDWNEWPANSDGTPATTEWLKNAAATGTIIFNNTWTKEKIQALGTSLNTIPEGWIWQIEEE